MTRAALGAVFIGLGLTLLLSASRQLHCEECSDEVIAPTANHGVEPVEEIVPTDD